MDTYIPKPLDVSNVPLPEELNVLLERLAANVHEEWAAGRQGQGWTYGPMRDEAKKETPCMVPYEALPEAEKDYDRNTAMATLKAILKMGYAIVPPRGNGQ